jgi:hypothetical protein
MAIEARDCKPSYSLPTLPALKDEPLALCQHILRFMYTWISLTTLLIGMKDMLKSNQSPG